MSDTVTPGVRVASGAATRHSSIAFFLTRRAAMTPEQAADDEYCDEVRRLDTYTVLARPESGPGLVQRRVFVDAELEAARAEAMASPERIAYIQRRSKEIRTERASQPTRATPESVNSPGSHAAVAAVFNAVEEATGRTLTPEERAELIVWLSTHAAMMAGVR